MDINSIEITDAMIDAVVDAQTYREDPIDNLRKAGVPKISNLDMQALYKRILSLPNFEERRKLSEQLASKSLVKDSVDTIMLNYNRLLYQAKQKGDFNAAARILREIRELKAIDNEQMKFEVIITVKKPEDNSNDKKNI